MHDRQASRPSLLGALLVAEGCLTAEQLEASLLIQKQDHPDLPLGEILVRLCYVTPAQLEHALAAQHDLRSSIVDAIGHHAPPAADLTALVVAPAADRAFARHLQSLGVDSYYAGSAEDVQALARSMRPDIVLVDPRSFSLIADAQPSPTALLSILPLPLEALNADELTAAHGREVLGRYVDQARQHARRRRADEELSQREFELRVLDTVFREVSKAPAHHGLGVLMTITRDIIGVEAATLFQLDHSARELVFNIVLGPSERTLQRDRLSVDRGIAGWVVRNSEPLLIPDARRDTRFEHAVDRRTGFETRSVLCVPLRAHGEVWGAIQLINKIDGAFTDRDLQILRIVAVVGGLLQEFDTRMEHESAVLRTELRLSRSPSLA